MCQECGKQPNCGLVTSLDEVRTLVTRIIGDGRVFGFDIETGYHGDPVDGGALRVETHIVAGFSFTNSLAWARYVPLAHDGGGNLDNLECAKLLWDLLATGLGVAHNAEFELRSLARWFRELLSDDPVRGKAVRRTDGYYPVFSDSMIEAYIMARWQSYALKPLIQQVFGHKMVLLAELFPDLPKNKRKTLRFNVLPLTPAVVSYACEDSIWCLAFHLKAYPLVKDQFLYKVEMEILTVVCEMEDTGLRYDWAFMREGAEHGKAFLSLLQNKVSKDLSSLTEHPVNINLASPAQISKVLYGELGMKTTRLTKSSQNGGEKKMSTDATALKGLAKDFPVVRSIVDWKTLARLTNVYLGKYEKDFGWAPDGMTHPSIMQTAVPAGRFAVSGPPYQQSPKVYSYELPGGETFKFSFRDSIVAPPDHYIIGFDYSQIELRVIAGEAQEQALIRAFSSGEDVHCRTASLMLGVPIEAVAKDGKERSVGKTLNFALLYGTQAKSLAERLGISRKEAADLIAQYFAVYSSIAAWVEKSQARAKADGYLITKFGRRVPIWEFQSQVPWIYAHGERLCINAPIQGGAADYVKIAMVRVRKAIREAGLQDRIRMVMNIHDALEFYVHKSVSPQQVVDLLQPAIIFPVKGWPEMEVEWHVGLRWGSVRKLDIGPDGKVSLSGAVDDDPVPDDPEGDLDDGEFPVEPGSAPSDFSEFLGRARGGLVESTGQSVPDPSSGGAHGDDRAHGVPDCVAAPGDSTAPRDESPGGPSRQGGREGPARVLRVTVTRAPEPDQFVKFLGVLRESPGDHKVVLEAPDGDVEIPFTTSLTPAHRTVLSLALGGAECVWEEGSVDPQQILAGLSL